MLYMKVVGRVILSEGREKVERVGGMSKVAKVSYSTHGIFHFRSSTLS